MDFRSHVVPALLIGTFMLLLLYGFSWLSDSSSRLEDELPRTPPRLPRAGANVRPLQGVRTGNSARVSQLRELLAARTTELNERTSLLNQKTKELEQLKKEYEEAAVHLQELILAQGTSDRAPELQRMQQALGESKAQLSDREKQLDELRAELLAANEEIVKLQIDAEMAIGQLLDERDAAAELQAAATRALRRTGAPAVAELTQLLNHEHPAVRRWAAQTLGGIGRDAQPAIPALLESLSDRDQRVRLAARAALEAIDRASQ